MWKFVLGIQVGIIKALYKIKNLGVKNENKVFKIFNSYSKVQFVMLYSGYPITACPWTRKQKEMWEVSYKFLNLEFKILKIKTLVF